MINLDMTVRQLLDLAKESDGLVQMVGHNTKGQPNFAIIAICGVPETREIMNAVAGVEKQWRADEQVEWGVKRCGTT